LTSTGTKIETLSVRVASDGFARVPANDLRQLLPAGAFSEWNAFAESWNRLSVDAYMADGGRYRRRRFAAFLVTATHIARKPHQPHYQSRDYNTLNGGIERWFDPITEDVASHPVLTSTLRMCFDLFDALTENKPHAWHVEAHQFRIEAHRDQVGEPTPEGLHRDGVDWVLVMLIARENIAEGVTTIHDLERLPLGSFTLRTPLDSAFVDDSRVYHGVTAIEPMDASKRAYRDVLVVTFRRP
jgi:hypothetical protein